MKNSIYVCYTLYHLYIALLKAYSHFNKFGIKSDIVLTDHIDNADFFLRQLNEIKFDFIDKVFFVPDKLITNNINKNIYNKFFYKRFIMNEYKGYSSLFNDKEIFIFLDITNLSRFLMFKYKKVNLIEDGYGIYRNYNVSFKDIIKNILGIPLGWGRSKYISKIYVNFPDKINAKIKNKILHLNLAELENLNKKDIEYVKKLLNLFNLNEKHLNNLRNNKNSVLILTQPFSESNFISEEEKIILYQQIIKKYLKKGFSVFLKPHPREKTEYSNFFSKDVFIFRKDFPIEIINFLSDFIKFDIVISVNSTSINNIKNGKKIMLGLSINEKLKINYNKFLQLDLNNEF